MQRMNKIIAMALLAGVMALAGWGCGAKKERISVAGSTSVQPIAETLAEEYMKDHPQASINVQGGGSSAGIKAAKDGTAQIGSSSRELKKEEQTGLTAVEIALDGIAIVVHPGNPVADLSLEQVRQIYAGELTNWAQVGGTNAAIVLVNREEGSGTRSAFTEIVMGKTPLEAKSIIQGSTGAVRQSVAQNQNAIGYISLAAVEASVKPVRINQVPCNVETIKQKKYPVIRPFLFVYKKPEAAGVKDFLDYVLNEGQSVVAKNGLIPVK